MISAQKNWKDQQSEEHGVGRAPARHCSLAGDLTERFLNLAVRFAALQDGLPD